MKKKTKNEKVIMEEYLEMLELHIVNMSLKDKLTSTKLDEIIQTYAKAAVIQIEVSQACENMRKKAIKGKKI